LTTPLDKAKFVSKLLCGILAALAVGGIARSNAIDMSARLEKPPLPRDAFPSGQTEDFLTADSGPSRGWIGSLWWLAEGRALPVRETASIVKDGPEPGTLWLGVGGALVIFFSGYRGKNRRTPRS